VKDIALPVPVVRQVNWCSCGLAALNMVFHYYGLKVTEEGLENHPLVRREFLQRHGFGPGRLGRIALSLGFGVTLIDPEEGVVGRRFVQDGGRWLRRAPGRKDLVGALAGRIPPVVCIPNKREAFEGSNSTGSHWVTLHSMQDGDFRLHDPAPWRKATRCKPGYWDSWDCSALLIYRATTARWTSVAPADRRASAQALAVAPVVRTSSTRSTRPRTGRDR
jgi:hypothetical protein